ncbi:MAG: adenylyl-sulfate kinase [Rhodocyclales bacterium]|nr:adenylyl-sulfate kinase [Rhodocyclales bacterium]
MTPEEMDPNLRWHPQRVTRAMRESHNGHRSVLVWFTGLPSSGKSTLAHGLEERLFADGRGAYVLDGDNVRHGLCRDLGFAEQDRAENIRRIGEVANLFLDAGIITLAAFISPFAADRRKVRELVGAESFIEVYCRCPVEVCEARDEKGNYAKAKAGVIARFTGISAPYQAPATPDLVLDTDRTGIGQSISAVLSLLSQRGVIAKSEGGHAA